MRKRSLFKASVALTILFSPILVTAQQRGAAASAPAMHVMTHPVSAPVAVHSSAHPASIPVAHTTVHSSGYVVAHPAAGRISARPGYTKGTIHTSPVIHSSGTNYGGTVPLAPVTSSDYGAPGLGFDYAHYFAVHPGARNRPYYGGAVYPYYSGGGYYYPGGYVDNGASQEVADETQQGEAGATDAYAPEVVPVEQSAAYERMRVKSSSAATPPLAPSPEYIFVRRDGTVFFAVAYSWLNGNLQYVTQDGLRKLVSLSTLDLDATTQFNEQRGIEFRSPA